MKMLFSLIAFLFLAQPVFAFSSPGKPAGYVNDFAGILSQETRGSLEANLRSFAEGENPQITVVTIKSLEGESLEEYANQLFREWGIGGKSKNNGILFLVSKEDRKMRIEVGYGLEGAVTDIASRHILDDIVRPSFRIEKYDAGITEGVNALQKALQGELVVTPSREKKAGMSIQSLETLLFLGVFVLSWLGSILGRSKSWWAGGVIGVVGGALAWLFTQWLYWVPLAAVVGLLFDYFVSKNYRTSKNDGSPSWWAGGGWGGWDRWGGGGDSFGGFGGGSSGGGGSGSNW